MYIEFVPNRNSRPAVLLREGWREGKKVYKRTLANLTDWSAARIEALRRVLKDEPVLAPQELFVTERSLPHGHVQAVLDTVKRLELDALIAPKGSRERDLVLAMLVARHLGEGTQVLYDVSSSYYEGHTCPLMQLGNDRDGKRGLPIVVYGALTDAHGRPIALQVYAGNTGDPKTVPDQVNKLREQFGLQQGG